MERKEHTVRYMQKEAWDAANTIRTGIKLNKKTDADIIQYLDSCGNKLGTIKAAIREYMESHKED